MINPKRLVEMARKWQKIASIGRRRISLTRTEGCITDKGHFVLYTADEKRFVVPLSCLNSYIFRELLKMSEDEFGLPGNRPIMLPCDGVFMEYVVSLVLRCVSEDVENALLISIASVRCSTSSSLPHGQSNQQLLIHGF